jgi:hypothetical protein
VKLGRHGAILARQNAARAQEQARKLKPVIREIRQAGKTTIRGIMGELNRRGIKTSRNCGWTKSSRRFVAAIEPLITGTPPFTRAKTYSHEIAHSLP